MSLLSRSFLKLVLNVGLCPMYEAGIKLLLTLAATEGNNLVKAKVSEFVPGI